MYNDDTVMTILPADHYIPDVDLLAGCIKLAEGVCGDTNIIIYGITPSYPATGYGYIQAGKEQTGGMFHVKQFKEKPDLNTATQYLAASGEYFWNSGMVTCRLSSMMCNFNMFSSQIMQLTADSLSANNESEAREMYSSIPSEPFDTAVLEKASEILMLPANFAWSDVGSWQALFDLKEKDEAGNCLNALNVALNSSGNLVISDKLVALLGVNNLVIVNTEDVLFVGNKDESERVKEVVEMARAESKGLV